MIDMNAEQKTLMRSVLYSSGLVFLMVSVVLFLKPELIEHIGLKADDANLIGPILMLVAVADFALARFMFANTERK